MVLLPLRPAAVAALTLLCAVVAPGIAQARSVRVAARVPHVGVPGVPLTIAVRVVHAPAGARVVVRRGTRVERSVRWRRERRAGVLSWTPPSAGKSAQLVIAVTARG